MKSQINQLLIRVLHEYIAGPKELVQFLVDTLDISRESAHRRLRNEIMFTFEEVCKIAQSLALSVDRLIGVNHAGTAFFDLYMHKSSDPIKIFTEILQVNTDLIIKTQHELPLRINIVLNRLPFGFTLVHENLAKFYYYKWLFHIQEPYSYVNFDEFVIPDQILDCYKKYIEASYNIVGDVIILLDENIFISKIKEINYFRRRGLISNDKIYEIRKELLLVVNMLEYMTQHGNYKSQTNIYIYLSSVDLEPSYMHMEYGDKSCVQFWSPSAQVVVSHNSEICLWQKNWIESLKRYATLITKCNEKERIRFFDNQRANIETLSADYTIEEQYLSSFN